jgi:hypothetical protein
MFALISDDEFSMWRDPVAIRCEDVGLVNGWKIGNGFQSQWSAD